MSLTGKADEATADPATPPTLTDVVWVIWDQLAGLEGSAAKGELRLCCRPLLHAVDSLVQQLEWSPGEGRRDGKDQRVENFAARHMPLVRTMALKQPGIMEAFEAVFGSCDADGPSQPIQFPSLLDLHLLFDTRKV